MKPLNLTLGAAVAAASLASAAPEPSAAPRPNILYLYADDLGWGSFSANAGAATATLTPAIDSLASTGFNFRRAYGCMVCSPARSSQQTGFHQGHTWTDRNDPAASKAMRADDKTIGDLLNAAGYRVGYYGKWGYGADSTAIDPAINNPQTLPINHGYTDLLAELHHVRAHTFFQESLWFNNIDTHGTNTVLDYNANTNNQEIAYADDLYAEAAESFIRTHANGPKPFFVEVAFQVPHTPLADIIQMPDWFADYDGVDTSTWPDAAKQYAAMVSRQDHHVAALLAALDDPNGDGQTNDSVRANTLVIFSSDNGGQGGTPYSFFDTNGNLTGTKGSVNEGGIRVPTFFSWPGVIGPGQSTDHITCVSDILPTLCDLAGILPPTGLDGVSIAPLLTGTGRQRFRPWYTHEAGSNWSLIRADGIKLRNTGALYNLADGSNANYEATDLLADTGDPMYPTYLQWQNEMQAIALAERVTEPNGFANTYHHWTGADGAVISEAANWSDYVYANGGTTYVSDNGAPRESWNATLDNAGAADQTAFLDTNVNTLGIEIAGNTNTGARQTVSLTPGNTLTGRNEIRLSPLATVELNGGTLASTRWVDLLEDATLKGPGTVDAILYNAGALEITTNVIATTNITINPGTGGVELVSNGGFELGTQADGDADYSYDELADWGTDHIDPSLDGGKASSAFAGVYRGLMAGTRNLIQDTGHGIQTGEVYQLTFQHRGFNGWDIDDELDIELFYDDGGSREPLYSFSIIPTKDVWNPTVTNFPAVTDPAAAGKALWINFSPGAGAGNSEFVSLDEVTLLIQNGAVPPTTNITFHTVAGVTVSGDYHQDAAALLDASLGAYTSLVVSGTATLDGRLACTLPAGFSAVAGDRFTVLSAASVTGAFTAADGMIECDGHHFRIHYAADKVELEKVAVTAAGTPHWWLEEHGLTNESFEVEDLLDRDGDGHAAWEEYIAGTLPALASSVLVVEPDGPPTGAGFIVHWPSVAERIYQVEGSTNPVAGFQPLESDLPAKPPENTYTDTTENVEGLYRVRAARS